MFVERGEITSFNKAWRTKTLTQASEELASYSLETKRIPDPYYFSLDQDGDLFSPSAQLKVKSIIDTTSRVGVLEAQAFAVISGWAKQEEAGAIAWLSPPEKGIYPVSKIIIIEIERNNGVKRILNRAIVLDIDEEECLDLGHRLSGYSKTQPFLTHLDQLRSAPIILDTKERSWLEIMQETIPDFLLWESVKRREEMAAKKEAVKEAERILTKYRAPERIFGYGEEQEMQREMQSMLGTKSGSCPVRFSSGGGQTAFQVFAENALTFTGSASKDPDFCKVCPVCEKVINCVVRAGGSCPKCGAVKRCG